VTTTLAGRCHCGNVELTFTTPRRPQDFVVGSCTCSFCRRHGARTSRDPAGRVEIVVHAGEHLIRHRFALGTADFLVCGRCGVYMAAVMTDEGRCWATVNVNTVEDPPPLPPATPMTFDGESVAARIARRKATWTPAVVVIDSGAYMREPP
jgi:hypothetical protein